MKIRSPLIPSTEDGWVFGLSLYKYDYLAVLFDAKIENKALQHALNGNGRNREFFSVAMKDFLLSGDMYAYRADQENGTKNACPLDPLKIRKYLKPHREEYSSHDEEDDGYSW